MTQYVINIGAVPNDGTGDPLRTAFNEVNLNFDQVFAAGPVLSNVQIANNTILTTNTNGNLVLAPNGVGVVQANAHIVPNTANIRNLGSADRRWNTVYVQYANVSGGLAIASLTATGNISAIGNVTSTNILASSRIISTPVALANLTVGAGSRAMISDGNLTAAGNFGAQVGGSGANIVPVWSDGTNWYIG